MSIINFQRTYLLHETYAYAKEQAVQRLGEFLKHPSLITFNDLDRSVTFTSEKLIPITFTNRPRVMLLFSNPHPFSIHQGMFLSPNTIGRENLFWSVMSDAGWIITPEKNPEPNKLADICLNADYRGPFDLIFYCYYAFPTRYPEDIIRIFGKEYFRQIIEPESMEEFKKTIQKTCVEAVITFNKGVFNLISNYPIEKYIKRLMDGELIQSQIKGIDHSIPIFLTFPTGWRYDHNYKQYRKASLDAIQKAICG